MPKKPSPRRADALSNEKLAQAIVDSHGLLSVAARKLGISRKTIRNRANKSEALQEAIQEAREFTADVAESALYKAMQAGEGWAVCFFLKCQAKQRGYVERQEITGLDGGPVDISVTRRVIPAANRITKQFTNGNGKNGNGNGNGHP